MLVCLYQPGGSARALMPWQLGMGVVSDTAGYRRKRLPLRMSGMETLQETSTIRLPKVHHGLEV